MTVERLAEVVPPPAAPYDAFDGPWERLEAQLGTALPQDYKDFVRLYGEGQFMEFLSVYVPYSWSPYVQLLAEAKAMHLVFSGDPGFPYTLWPEPGGLLVWGGTDFGDYLFWLTDGPPDDWRVVMWGRGSHQTTVFEVGLTDLLAGMASGKIDSPDFPELLPCDCLFLPGTGNTRGGVLPGGNYADRPPRGPVFGPLRARLNFVWPGSGWD